MSPGKCLSLGFVNVYFVGEPGADWALIDTGLPWHFTTIVRAAAERYGKSRPPRAIWLTHGHPDHVGAARALAAYWNVPIYTHPDELPYVSGQCDYPPGDPSSCGGLLSIASRFASSRGTDLRPFVRPFPARLLAGWSVVPLPGHTPGSVGFWHKKSRTLVAGDAMTNLRLDSWRPTAGLNWPPQPFTTDWMAVRKSLWSMIDLEPRTVVFGHGQPLTEADGVLDQLRETGTYAMIARHGRYVGEPVRLDSDRHPIVAPLAHDPAPKVLGALAVGVLVAGMTWGARRRRARP